MNEVKEIIKVIEQYAHQLRENEWKHDMQPWQETAAESSIKECFMRLKMIAIYTHCKDLIDIVNDIFNKDYTGCSDIDVYNIRSGALLKAFELYSEGVIS